ncbi:hypothetical protein [Solidesulfovibrio sp.]
MTYAAHTYPESIKGFADILGQMTAGANPRGAHFQYIRRYAYDLVRLSIAAVTAIRAEAEKPDADLQGMCHAAASISVSVKKLVAKVGKRPALSALKPLFSSVLTEWEDLAEDLALVQNAESRKLLGQICDVLASRSDQDQDWRQLDFLR